MLHKCILVTMVAMILSALASDNDIVLNLEPSKNNPRNSEGAFVTVANGNVLFLYTQFYGGAGDASPARIAAIESGDGGATWNAPRVVIENDGKENIMSVSLLRLKGGKIALVYLLKNGLGDCRPIWRISEDETKTWSPPKQIVAEPIYLVVNNDRLVQLSSGRLLLPVAWHDNQGGKFNAHAADRFYYSDDDGASWQAAARAEVPASVRAGLQEPGVVEVPDGSVLAWARTGNGAQYGFTSTDGGLHWSEPKSTELKSPLSPASIKRLTDSKLLAIFNDHSGQFEFVKGKRTPLVSAISSDNGATWTQRKSIESDKDGWYCYTAIHLVGDHVLLAYCAGDSKVGGLNRLRIRRLSRTWFEMP